MLASSDTLGFALANGLGIETHNLNNLKIEFSPGMPVLITACYYVETPTLVQVLEPFQDKKQYVLVEATNVGNSL